MQQRPINAMVAICSCIASRTGCPIRQLRNTPTNHRCGEEWGADSRRQRCRSDVKEGMTYYAFTCDGQTTTCLQQIILQEQVCSTCVSFGIFAEWLFRERQRGCGKIGLLLRPLFPPLDATCPAARAWWAWHRCKSGLSCVMS